MEGEEVNSKCKFEKEIVLVSEKIVRLEIGVEESCEFGDEFFKEILKFSLLLISFLIYQTDFGVKNYQLQSIIKVLRAFNLNLGLKDSLTLVLKELLKLVDAHKGSIVLIEDGKLTLAASVGIPRKYVKNTRISPMVKYVLETGDLLLVNDEKSLRKIKKYLPDDFPRNHYTEMSFIILPLKMDDEIIGVINVSEKKKGKFTLVDKWMLENFAQYAVALIRNAQMYSQLKDLPIAVMESFAQALEAKDAYTRGHSERVTLYSVLLAHYLELDEDLINIIRQAGVVHDIGKIGIPDAILNKPGRLTDEEYDMIKLHPVIGANILAPIEFLKEIKEVVLYHHERWDGRGYPEGLKGEEIPLTARILAIGDTFDAMTSSRPYRKALPVEIALAEIERCAGAQFDPEIAYKFLEVWEKMIIYIWDDVRDKSDFNMDLLIKRALERLK